MSSDTIIAMYSLYHPEYTPQRWQIFIAFIAVTWTACSIVLFGQRLLPKICNLSAAICIGGFFITCMVCLIMPSQTGYGYASSSTVWATWDNQTGYASNGFVFVAGMLNGAFAIGTPDGVSNSVKTTDRGKSDQHTRFVIWQKKSLIRRKISQKESWHN